MSVASPAFQCALPLRDDVDTVANRPLWSPYAVRSTGALGARHRRPQQCPLPPARLRGGGAPPAWIQVRNAVGQVRRGDPPDRLRPSAEAILAALEASDLKTEAVPEPWVEVTADGRRQWQVSFPEDIVERLGQDAYVELEDRLAAVQSAQKTIMEDRDRAVVRTRRGVTAAELAARLEAVVVSLAIPHRSSGAG